MTAWNAYWCPTCSTRHTPRCQPARTWPMEALEAHARHGLAHSLGISTDTYRLAMERGLSDTKADRYAIRLGVHPSEVWEDWVDAGLSVPDRVFLENGWRQAWLAREAS